MSKTDASPPLFDEFDAVEPAEWRERVRSDLGGTSPESFLEWTSVEGVSLPAYLTPEALEAALHANPEATVPPLSESSEAPANAWTVCQPIRHPDPAVASEQAEIAVEGGAEALEINASLGDAEGIGLAVHSKSDFARVLDGIDLTKTDLHLTGGSSIPALFALLQEHLSDENIAADALGGSALYDPVAALASGADPARSFLLADDLVAEATHLPHFQPVAVDTSVYHDAGASAVQELACALGALTERLARRTDRGLPLSDLLDPLQIRAPISTSYFVEMAKLRALRLLVPQVIDAFAREADAALDVRPTDLVIHATTSRRTETIYDPYVNMLRATTEAMAAVLGGCDVMTIRPYDATLSPPDEFGLRIARNTQLILRHEAHFEHVADPAAGSYYIETMTDQLAQEAWAQFQDLEAEGGIVETLRSGSLQDQLAETRQKRRRALDERDQVLVGTTHYPALDERRRNDVERPETPSTHSASTSSDASSIEAIRSALREGTTLQEVASAVVSGSTDIDPLPRIRLAEEIESIRLRTDAYAQHHDGPPQFLLAPIGPPAIRSTRATFARNVLGVAGFAIEEPLKFESVDAVADRAVEEETDAVVLCSANADYADLAPALTSALKERNHSALLGIAAPPEDIEVGGVADFFVHQGSSLQTTLLQLQNLLGIPTDEA